MFSLTIFLTACLIPCSPVLQKDKGEVGVGVNDVPEVAVDGCGGEAPVDNWSGLLLDELEVGVE